MAAFTHMVGGLLQGRKGNMSEYERFLAARSPKTSTDTLIGLLRDPSMAVSEEAAHTLRARLNDVDRQIDTAGRLCVDFASAGYLIDITVRSKKIRKALEAAARGPSII